MTARKPKPPADPRAALLATVDETAFQNQVIAWAKRAGWLVSAQKDSRKQWWGTDKGIPDLIMAKEGRVIFAELKTAHGYVSRDQGNWLMTLLTCPGVETVVWRPSDEDEIKRVLGA